jgi:hypothetical protein
MYVTKSADEVDRLLRDIPHKTCTNAIDKYWKVGQDGRVRAQSVLWLFCWAKTGMGSEAARMQSVEVFNKVLPTRFEELDAVLDHDYARRARYLEGDIEETFGRAIKLDG